MWSTSPCFLSEVNEISSVLSLGEGVSNERESVALTATHLVLVCIADVHLLRLPFTLPFFQFLPELFHILPLIGRPILVRVVQHGPAEECFVGSNSYADQMKTVLLVTSHKSVLVPGCTQLRLTQQFTYLPLLHCVVVEFR